MDVILGDMALSRGRWKVLDTEGWLDTPGFEVPSVQRLRHGSLAGPGRATGRTIKITGRVENTDHEQQIRDRNMLAGLFRDGGLVPMSATLGGLKLSTEVRLIDQITFQPSSFAYSTWEISLYAQDPWLFTDWRETLLRPLGSGVGFEFPPFSGARMNTSGNLITDPTGLDLQITEYRLQTNPGWNLDGGEWVRAGGVDETNEIQLEHSAESLYTDIDLVPGTRYELGTEVQLDTGTAGVRFAIRYALADGSQKYAGDSTEPYGNEEHYTAIAAGGWRQVTRWWDVPEDAVTASLAIQINNVVDATEVRVQSPSARTTEPVISFGSEVGTTDWVWNDGNAESYPQFEVTGNFPGGFSVGMGGRRVTYPWPTYPDMPVLVDMAGSLSVSGVDQSQQVSERGWSSVPPSSIATPYIHAIQGGTGWATVRHRDTYI